ncbi:MULTISPECIES: hypothetical protein [unclassified Lysobacter]|uniref:hypothetical protein n=1 Tax=unclassified Lysobacter TaxID=2635362 RepID=UPI0012FA8279|nr:MULTISPECIES: hypothetical protein [unclassified Lysobacter]
MSFSILDQVGVAISSLNGLQWLFVILFVTTAVVGGNAVFYLNAKRRGLSGRTGLSPFNFPVSTLSGWEWLSLVLVMVVSLVFAVLAVISGSQI